MQVETRDGGKSERNVLVGMAVSDVVLGAVAAKWPHDGLFISRASNILGGWCVDYWKRYRKAPGPALEQMFDRWAQSGRPDRDTAELVEKFLRALSGQYAARRAAINPAFVIDQAAAHFTAVRLRAVRDGVDAALSSGDWERADETARSYRRLEMGADAMVRPFADPAAVKQAFSGDFGVDLIVLPGAAGKFFRHVFARECFVGLEGMAKVGKSFWLMYLVFMAVLQKRRVAFFETGDMSQDQIVRRLASLAAKRPIYGDPKHPVRVPIGIEAPGPGDIVARVDFREQLFPRDLDPDTAGAALARFGGKYGEDTLRLSVHRNRSINMMQIENRLDEWASADWVPDVIAIDYMDLLAPINGRTETRDEINETWQAGRSAAMKYHACVIGPTQSDTASYNAAVIKRENFSGDRRKNDHVTAMIGINQQQKEKEASVYRLNYAHGRDVDFTAELWCAACLALSNPCVLTTTG